MIKEIRSVKNVPAFIENVKSGEGGKLMGFGHWEHAVGSARLLGAATY